MFLINKRRMFPDFKTQKRINYLFLIWDKLILLADSKTLNLVLFMKWESLQFTIKIILK